MSINAQTEMGAVSLTIADLERSLSYYQHRIGLELLRREGNTAALGVAENELLLLVENPAARHVPRSSGLYHYAVLLPSRKDLSQTLHHLIATETPIGGASDHSVSEALYLTDPDGNGIEIYADRARTLWQYPNGQLRIDTQQLDFEGLLAETSGDEATWKGMPPGTKIGHVHLHVANLDAAVRFYTETIGFDLIAYYGQQAGFVSAGGYHHHLGMNTWAGVGAPPPPPNATGLRYFTIHLPDQDSLDEVSGRLQAADIPVQQTDDGYTLADPSKNGILLKISPR